MSTYVPGTALRTLQKLECLILTVSYKYHYSLIQTGKLRHRKTYRLSDEIRHVQGGMAVDPGYVWRKGLLSCPLPQLELAILGLYQTPTLPL